MTAPARTRAVPWTAAYVLLAVVALALFAAPLWYAWSVTIHDGRLDVLRADSQHLDDVFGREGLDGLKRFLDYRVRLQIAGDRLLALADDRGRILGGNLGGWPPKVPTSAGVHSAMADFGGQWVEAEFVETSLPGGYHLLVGRDAGRYQPLEQRFVFGLGAAVLLVALMGALGGFLIRRELLTRVGDMQQAVAVIMQGDLQHRLPTRSSGDEMDTMALTINGMLDHIEHLIGGISSVSNAIAHDLRTPLAELRSRLETLSLGSSSPSPMSQELDACVADVDRVIALFNALLRLAEIDSGARRAAFARLDLSALAHELGDLFEPVAEAHGQRFSMDVEDGLLVNGDRLLLVQALSNVIDNALKFSPAGGSICLMARRAANSMIAVGVHDTGPGIPPGDRDRVVQRFARGDSSRGTPGVGLGLSIVDAVARLHGGTLRLADNAPGLRAELYLPEMVA